MARFVRTEEVPDPVAAAVGDLLEVRLVENAGTGYVWELAEPPGCLRVVEDVTEVGSLAAVGAASLRVFTLSATAVGSGELVLVLRRAWEPAPLRTLSWPVTVS